MSTAEDSREKAAMMLNTAATTISSLETMTKEKGVRLG